MIDCGHIPPYILACLPESWPQAAKGEAETADTGLGNLEDEVGERGLVGCGDSKRGAGGVRRWVGGEERCVVRCRAVFALCIGVL